MVLPPLLRAARRLAASRPEARRFAARAWVSAPLVRASLALVGLRTTLRWIEAAPPGRWGEAPVGVDEGRALVRGAFRVHLVTGACLHQSLVQYLLHRRDGLAVRLVLGVKRSVTMGETPKPPAQPLTMGETPRPPAQPGATPGIAAHAWVEGIDGEACPSDDPSFAPIFVSAPAPRGTRGIAGRGSPGSPGVAPTKGATVAEVPGASRTT